MSSHHLYFLIMPELCYHHHMHIHIADIISFMLYATVLSLSVIALPESSETLYVEADGVEYAYSLSENGIYSFTGPIGITEIEIKDGKARVISSPCPNGTCMSAGWSDVLCCLPNRIIATTGNSSEGDVNAVSG